MPPTDRMKELQGRGITPPPVLFEDSADTKARARIEAEARARAEGRGSTAPENGELMGDVFYPEMLGDFGWVVTFVKKDNETEMQKKRAARARLSQRGIDMSGFRKGEKVNADTVRVNRDRLRLALGYVKDETSRLAYEEEWGVSEKYLNGLGVDVPKLLSYAAEHKADNDSPAPDADGSVEPTPEVNTLKELLENNGQRLMEHLGAYSGGNYNDPDILRLRENLIATGVDLTGIDDVRVREIIWSRTETARQLLLAQGSILTDIDAMSGEDLMRNAQDAYFHLLGGQNGERLIDQRNKASEASFDRRGLDSNAKKQILENMRRQLGTTLDRVITDMDFYNHTLSNHRVFQENYGEWLYGDITVRLERYKLLTKDGGIREKLNTPHDWVVAIRAQLEQLEKQMAGGSIDVWLQMKIRLEAAVGGYMNMIPVFEAMDDPALAPLKEKMEAEVAARAGIDSAFKIWDGNRTDASKLISAMVGRVGKDGEEAPSEKLKFFSMDWLEALSSAEEGLGQKIGLAMTRYIKIGERDLQRYYRTQELRETTITTQRRLELNDWLAANPSLGRNIFSDKDTNDVAAGTFRREIANDPTIGKEAEELGFRLMYLFGLSAKYDIDQSVAALGCYYRDDLASMMRPNDPWQDKDRILSSVDIGPYDIVGQAGVFANQPLRHIGFLVSFPDMVGQVRMKDGSVASMTRMLAEGKFADVDWREIPAKYSYSAFVRRMDKARQVKAWLLAIPPGDMKDVEEDTLAKNVAMLESALTEYRPVALTEQKTFTTATGVVWSKPQFKRREGPDDHVVQAVLRNKMMAIVKAHDASRGVEKKDTWSLVEFTKMRRNLGRFLRADYMNLFLSPAKIATMVAGTIFTLEK